MSQEGLDYLKVKELKFFKEPRNVFLFLFFKKKHGNSDQANFFGKSKRNTFLEGLKNVLSPEIDKL